MPTLGGSSQGTTAARVGSAGIFGCVWTLKRGWTWPTSDVTTASQHLFWFFFYLFPSCSLLELSMFSRPVQYTVLYNTEVKQILYKEATNLIFRKHCAGSPRREAEQTRGGGAEDSSTARGAIFSLPEGNPCLNLQQFSLSGSPARYLSLDLGNSP